MCVFIFQVFCELQLKSVVLENARGDVKLLVLLKMTNATAVYSLTILK